MDNFQETIDLINSEIRTFRSEIKTGKDRAFQLSRLVESKADISEINKKFDQYCSYQDLVELNDKIMPAFIQIQSTMD